MQLQAFEAVVLVVLLQILQTHRYKVQRMRRTRSKPPFCLVQLKPALDQLSLHFQTHLDRAEVFLHKLLRQQGAQRGRTAEVQVRDVLLLPMLQELADYQSLVALGSAKSSRGSSCSKCSAAKNCWRCSAVPYGLAAAAAATNA